ncbi:MAG: DUF3499 family protein [Actinomycetota bacterium]
MKFLCGRPGCGKESTATLQIDAPSETVSLVDPRISRDGVPLCARHADATTPPMGWTMNDLRSRNRSLSAVPDEGAVPTSTPPRVRPEPASARKMSRRQSIEERATRTEGPAADDDHLFRSSRTAESESADAEPVTGVAAAAAPAADQAPVSTTRRRGKVGAGVTDDESADAPESRPTRRRDVPEESAEPEERFPWHHQYQDDEPEEMQASSPLLSRAFRSSTG